MSEALSEFRRRYGAALTRLHRRGDAARWNLDEDSLAATAFSAVSAASMADAAAVEAFLDSLRASDLALAAACKAGDSAAWEYFIATARPPLYSAARAIAGDEIRGRELADSLWADLYGLEVRGGRRRSILEYFHGRSSLLTWLRAMLAQRHVDYIRAARRTDPLDENLEPAHTHEDDDPPEPGRARYVQLVGIALESALNALEPRDRLLLGYYYRHQLSLKQIGRLMNEHESTVSRRLARIRGQLKIALEHTLGAVHGLSREQIQLCYDYAAGDLRIDLSRALPDVTG